MTRPTIFFDVRYPGMPHLFCHAVAPDVELTLPRTFAGRHWTSVGGPRRECTCASDLGMDIPCIGVLSILTSIEYPSKSESLDISVAT